MKKEIKNVAITLLTMSVVTVLLLALISILVFVFKWKSAVAVHGITGTYIVTGLAGGLLQGFLCRRVQEDTKGTIPTAGKIGLGKAFIYGMVIATLYWGIPGGVAMLLAEENISDMGRLATVWSMMAGSIAAGILIEEGRKKKDKIQKEG